MGHLPYYENFIDASGSQHTRLVSEIVKEEHASSGFGWIDVKEYGAKGDGLIDDTVALTAAKNAGAGKTVMFPPGTYKLTDNLTFPSGTAVWMLQGAIINVAAGKTLTLNGPLFGSGTAFTGSGTTTISTSDTVYSGSTTPTLTSLKLGTPGTLYNYTLNIMNPASGPAVHIAPTGSNAGGYLESEVDNNFSILEGAYSAGGVYIATATDSSQIHMGANNIEFFTDTGLTIGNPFTPSRRAYINATQFLYSSGDAGTPGIAGQGFTTTGLYWTSEPCLRVSVFGVLVATFNNISQASLATLGLGTSPALSGVLGCPNNTHIKFRNVAGNADITAFGVDSSNYVVIDAGAGGSYFGSTLIGIGGTSSSFPALKRSGVNLQVRLADDSAYAAIDALSFKAGGSVFATAQSSPSDPTGTTNTSGLMMGLAGAITTRTGRIYIHIQGTIKDNTGNDGGSVQARYGTGTAPVNGAALTGTTIGSLVRYVAANVTTEEAPFCVGGVVTGLSIGTAYWLDVALAAITGGTANITNVSVTAFDIA